MYDTHTPIKLHRTATEINAESRLSWLLAANAREAYRRRLFRTPLEEEEMLLMHHPISTKRAYALLGLLLGALPPAMIFTKIFGYGLESAQRGAVMFILCLAMNAACAVTGYAIGSVVGGAMKSLEQWSWNKMLLALPLMGALWGAVSGTAGGLLFFGVGAIFGALCAIPVGMAAFALFAPFHRLLARGGMIDARHFWPLACGVSTMIAALILGM